MTAFEHILPPKAIASSENSGCGLGFLEIEVSRLNFIIDRVNDTTPTYLNNNKNSSKNRNSTPIGIQGATAKFIWWGENREKSASVAISRAKETTTSSSLHRKNSNHTKKQQTPPSSLLQCHNKLRYTIRTSLTLFLDYLRSCEPIEIIVTTSASSLPLGQALLRPPADLLRKYASNYTSGCTFEHKTKIYALYKNTPRTVQNHQHHHQQKTGEIQLRFRMLFAASCKPVSALQEQLTLQRKHDAKELKATSVTHSLLDESKAEKSAPKPLKSDEIVEAMMKLDAKLVAYLAGEDMSSNSERLESLEELQNASSSISQLVGEMVEERFCEQQLDVFKRISSIKLQMEALTLQPEGTKRMELLQSEIRPIFTVECQMSHELIQGIPSSDMFHIMQFESEKFQSLTQCTRFGQESQRDVHISVDDDASSDDELNFGRIHFTVWWREPGTCLNEMLGMGVLDLKELYNASLLEQCKCITINRRNVHLASLYFKISLQLPIPTAPGDVQVENMLQTASIKQCSGDNGDGEKKGNVPQTSTEKAQSGKAPAAAEEANSASAQNNNLQLDSSHFTAETSKVRLLKGFIYASETRNFEVMVSWEYFLVCRRFWQEEAFSTMAGAGNCFNYQEQFSVINEQKFLNRVDRQHLQLEVWRRSTVPDGNGNGDGSLEPVGIVRLPLHQFFIAYRDAAITNHLCKGKLPVISIDAWVPITNCSLAAGAATGELKCLLAIGSEEQIINLKESRGFALTAGGGASSTTDNALCPKNALTDIPEILDGISQSGTTTKRQPLKKTNDLFDMLQKALMAQPPGAPPPAQSPPQTSASASKSLEPLQQTKTKSFKFTLDIQRATGLPLNPPTKAKKGSKRSAAAAVSKRFPSNEAPSTYVTFQADSGNGMVYKSHEGVVYATSIFPKSTNPLWQNRFCVAASVDYLTNPQKRFILKIWKKVVTDLAEFRLQPTPMDDAIIGFAALDLTAFLQGQNIGGVFNIVDFNGRISGQLEVRCQPLDDIHKILQPTVHGPLRSSQAASTATVTPYSSAASVDSVIDQFENSLDLSHLNIGQAIKRKFTELEEISQRLRSRLVDVTGEQFEPNFNISGFDSWQPLDATPTSLDIVDDDLDEFERDINTPQLSPNTTTAQNDNNDTKTISGATEPSPKE